MKKAELTEAYLDYIACLNKQDWTAIGRFVDDEAHYNGRPIGLSGYREMLERDFREIPDLFFNIDLLLSDPPHIAARLRFRLHAERCVFWNSDQRKKSFLHRERLLSIPGEEDLAGVVGDRQRCDRGAAFAGKHAVTRARCDWPEALILTRKNQPSALVGRNYTCSNV